MNYIYIPKNIIIIIIAMTPPVLKPSTLVPLIPLIVILLTSSLSKLISNISSPIKDVECCKI